jgi:hypothetical protein
MINWIADLNHINPRPKTHNEAVINKDMCLNTFNDDYNIEFIKDYSIYIMIRNPYDRIFSIINAHNMHNDLTFLEYARNNKDWNFKYYYPLVEHIIKNNTNYKIIQFENFKNDLKEIVEKHNIPISYKGNQEYYYTNDLSMYKDKIYNIKLSNFTHGIVPYYKHFYNQEIINIIYKVFKIDFDLFNIQPNIDDLYPQDI